MRSIEENRDSGGYLAPVPVAAPIEARIAWSIVRRVAVVGPLVVGGAGVWRGLAGALSAGAGVAIVSVNFLVNGLILTGAARVSVRAYHAAALFGFFVRLGLIAVMMLFVALVFEVDRPALGIAAVVAYLTLLTWEAWALTRSPGRETEWT